MLITRENTPRWLIFLIDLTIVICAVFFAYMLRFNFDIPAEDARPIPGVLLFIALIRAASFLAARSYAGIIRYTSTGDALRVVGGRGEFGSFVLRSMPANALYSEVFSGGSGEAPASTSYRNPGT